MKTFNNFLNFKNFVSFFTIGCLIVSLCGVGIFGVAASGTASVVIADGTTKGEVSGLVTFTSNVPGISPDDACCSVRLDGNTAWPIVWLNSKKVSETMISASNIKTIHFWVKNSSGAGQMLLKLTCRQFTPSLDQGLGTGKLYLINTLTGETSTQISQGGGDIYVPDGFEGYVVYDVPTFEKKDVFLDANDMRELAFIFGGNSSNQNKTWYYDNITISNEAAADIIKSLSNRIVAPKASQASGFIPMGSSITLTADDGANIYYTTDASTPSSSSQKYNDPILVNNDMVLKTIAIKDNSSSVVMQYDYKIYDPSLTHSVVIADGSKNGGKSGNLEYRANVTGISPDNNCYAVTMTGENTWPVIWFDSPKLTEIGVPADNVKTICYWIENPEGAGAFNALNICSRNDNPYVNQGLGSGTYYLVDTVNRTSTVKSTGASGNVVVPDGFQGYVIYDVSTFTDREKVMSQYDMQYLGFIFGVNNAIMVGKTWYFDNVTVSEKKAELVIEDLLQTTKAPTANVFSGLVAAGREITLTADEGATIYYTLDGSRPTTTSIKYNVESPIKITSTTVLKAIACKNSLISAVVTYNYQILDPSLDNATLVNSGADIININSSNGALIPTVVDGVSPDGSAYSVYGNSSSGASLLNIKLSAMETAQLIAQEGFSFWTRVPKGMKALFAPNFNNEIYGYKGDIITYNTVTGVTEEYTNVTEITLENFEGYVIMKLSDEPFYTKWGEKCSYTWRDFVNNFGASELVFYIPNDKFYGGEFAIDSCAFIANCQKYLEDIKQKPLRPAAPSADPPSGAVASGTNINLEADSGTDIYYTLDGTVPTISSTRYVMIGMGNGQPDASPIALMADTVIRAIAVKDGIVSGVASFKYEIESPYTGPNSVVINDGSGEGKNKFSWYSDSIFKSNIVDGVSPDGKALTLQPIVASQLATTFHFSVDTEKAEQIHNIAALSFWIKVPDLGDKNKVDLGLRINGEENYYNGTIYAISKDGKVQKFQNNISLSNFEGLVVYTISGNSSISLNYGASNISWKSFIKKSGLNSLGFYIAKPENQSNKDMILTFDSFSLHYNMNTLFTELNLEGLLASYDAGTVENANMMVANDCSGNKINGGLTDFSSNLVVEKSTYSADDRCLALTFSEGDSFIKLPDYCIDESAMIADGVTFWIATPKGSGDIPLEILLTDMEDGKSENFKYSDIKSYYRIDTNGVISRNYGSLSIPDGFRGWVVIPNDNLSYSNDASGFVNGVVDYDKIDNISFVFTNQNNYLKGRTIYLDDISYYLSFEKLVKTRATQWDTNSLINNGNTVPGTGDGSPVLAISILLSCSLLAVLILRRKRV